MITTANIAVTSTLANGTPYISSSNQIKSYGSNKYCQAGVDDIQTVYDSMTSGLGYCLQLSSGSHAVSEFLI